MPDVVIDASVAAKWQLEDEAFRTEAGELFRLVQENALNLVVPYFWSWELAGVLSKAVAGQRISEDRAANALRDLVEIPHEFIPLPPPEDAFRASRRFERAVIDSFYLTLAEERGCDFWTDDRKLVRGLGSSFPWVRWLGDWPAPSAMDEAQ